MKRTSRIMLIVFACLVLLATKSSKKMVTLAPLANDRLQVKCDDSCSDEEKKDLVVATKWLNQNETPGSCFDRKFREHTNLDQTQWLRDHSNVKARTTEEIAIDLTTSSASSDVTILRYSRLNLFKDARYGSMCAGDNADGSVTAKARCFDNEGYRMKAMTVAHELSHVLNYEHTNNGYIGNENTVPYVVQDVVCRCWTESKGPMKPGHDDPNFDCSSIYR